LQDSNENLETITDSFGKKKVSPKNNVNGCQGVGGKGGKDLVELQPAIASQFQKKL